MLYYVKKLSVCLSLWAICLVLSSSLFAQNPRIVVVEPGFATLNTAIVGDTLPNGARVDTNTVYMLRRGPNAIYLLDGSIENRFPLTIEAESGNGERPKIIPGVGGGGSSSRPFRARDNLTLRGLYVTNEDELGGLNTRIIRISADNAKIVVDDCHLDKDGQSAFRLDNAWISIFITNSIVSNIGVTNDPNNGRGIDDRGNPADSIVIENSTFYNLTSRVIRDAGGIINYARFNHNTLVNIGQFAVTFGEVAKVAFTNNLLINTGFYGHDSTDRQAVAIDSLIGGGVQVVNIRNNNFYLDPALEAAYPADSVSAIPFFNTTAQNFIDQAGTGATMLNEAISFANGPAVPTDVVTAFWNSPSDPQPPLDTAGEPFDFGYPNTTQSFSWGTDSKPLGAVTWFGLTVGIEDIGNGQIPAAYELRDNYPNPFNPETNIEYTLPANTLVRVTVYNLLGQKIATLVNKEQTAGIYRVNWNGITDSGVAVSSGIYFYRMETPSFTKVKRMLLMK